MLRLPKMRLAVRVRQLCVAAAIVASAANAHAADEPCTASPVPIAAASFTPRRTAEGIAWDARWIVENDASFEFHGGRLIFAAPLPPGERLVDGDGLTLLPDGSGVCVRPEALHDRTIHATFVQPAGTSLPLGAPVAEGHAVQIVGTTLGDSRLEPIGGRLERHVGYMAPRVVSDAARAEARRLTDMRPKVTEGLVYLRGEDAPGLELRVLEPPARRTSTAVFAFAIFAGLVAALVVAARRLRQRASVEHADALLAAEIDEAAR